jgi:hypothetical protein
MGVSKLNTCVLFFAAMGLTSGAPEPREGVCVAAIIQEKDKVVARFFY